MANLWTVQQLCQRMGVSKDWVYRRLDALPTVRFGRLVRFDADAAEKFIQRHLVDMGGSLSVAKQNVRKGNMELTGRVVTGGLRLRGRSWEVNYPEYVIVDGERVRRRRFIRIGTLDQYPNEAAAKRRLRSMVNKVDTIRHEPLDTITLGEFYETVYQPSILSQMKPNTVWGYEHVWKKHVKSHLRQMPMALVKPLDIQLMINTMRAGRKNDRTPSWKTKQNARNLIGSLFKYAIRLQVLSATMVNPAHAVSLGQEPRRPERFLPSDETLGRVIEGMEEPYRTIGMVTFECSLRIGEVLGLSISSIDWQKKQIKIERETVRGGALSSPKTKHSYRCLLVSDRLLQQLQETVAKLEDKSPEAWLFPSRTESGPIRSGTMWKKVVDASAAAGFRFSPHWLRHWSGSVIFRTNPKAAQLRLGHSRLSTTMNVYAHTDEKADQRASRAVSRVMHRAGVFTRNGGNNGGKPPAERLKKAVKSSIINERRGTQVA